MSTGRRSLRKALVMTTIAAVAVGGFVFVFTQPPQNRAGAKPSAVESVFPEGGNLNLRQVAIVADLAPGHTGYLLLDGIEVPRDDLVIVDPLNTVSLQPQPGSDYAELEPGPHCATIVYRRIGRPESESSSYRWCFSLA
ncbi:MAG: hypothetical protein ACT4OS_02870 [Acidimicrobiales bacterium]